MDNIKENASFNARLLELRNAYLAGDTKTVRFLIDNFKAKKEYYDTVTVESLTAQAEQIINNMTSNGNSNLSESEREALNAEIAKIREEIVEKKQFVKNEELVNEICSENLVGELETKTRRIKRNRTLVTVGAVAAGVILIALAAKGCSKDKTKTNNTIPTTTITYSGDETVSTSDYSNEETAPIDYFISEESYAIDPVIGEPTIRNNGNNGSTSGTNNGTTGVTTTNGTSSATPTPYINIPGVNTTDVVITVDDNGRIQEITWPTAETTRVVPLPDTDPHGNDPLPVEPSHTNTGDTGEDRPAVITVTPAPAPVVTPAVPTGDVPGTSETVYPTEVNPTVPTDASEPTAPTAAPTDPTSQTLPDIPTWDLPDDNAIEYDINGHVVSNTMTLRR